MAHTLIIPDNNSFMFDDDSMLHKCLACGYRLDFFAHNPHYRLCDNRWDLSSTYDGQTIGSRAFKSFCEREGLSGIDFLEFDSDREHFHIISRNIVVFDAARRESRFENPCTTCGNYESIVGATPSFLKLDSPLIDGFYRSDLLFASGNEKSPLEFVGLRTCEKMKAAQFRGVHFQAAMGTSRMSLAIDTTNPRQTK